MYNRISTYLIIILCLVSNISNSQKPQSGESEFDFFMNKGEVYFQNGDYLRAKNVFDYCAKMSHPLRAFALKKKETAINLYLLKETANRKFAEGNDFEERNILRQILAVNPLDKYSKDRLNTNQNESEKPVITFKPTTTNTQKPTPSKIVISKPNHENEEKIEMEKHLAEAKKAIKDGDTKRARTQLRILQIAGYKPNDIKNLVAVVNKIEEEGKPKPPPNGLDELKKQYNKLLTEAKRGFKQENYSLAKRKYLEAQKVGYGNKKAVDDKVNQIVIIERYLQDIQKIKNNSSLEEDLFSLYSKVLAKNSDANKLRKEYFDLIADKLSIVNTYDESGCLRKQKLVSKLQEIDKTRFEGNPDYSRVIKDCESCNYNKFAFSEKLIVADRTLQAGNYTLAIDFLNEAKSQLETIMCFKDAEKVKFNNDIDTKLTNINNLLANGKCRSESERIVVLLDSLIFNKQFEEVKEISAKIDTNCLLNPYKIKLKDVLKSSKWGLNDIARKKILDSADRSRKLSYNYDECSLILKAKLFCNTKSDSIDIDAKFKNGECNCVMYKQNCPEIRNGKMVICKDTSTKFKVLFEPTLGLSGWNKYDLSSYNDIKATNFNFVATTKIPNIGLRVNTYNYKKIIDFRYEFAYSSKNIEINSGANSSNQINLNQFKNQLDIKLHTLPKCPPNLRYFLFSGINTTIAKANLQKPIVEQQKLIDNIFNNTFWGGYSVGLGIEKSNHKPFLKGFSFEVYYSRNGIIYDKTQKLLKSPFKSDVLNSFVGVKVGIYIF
ncbi:hypothetical protein [Emticicia sp.]|uniref:hypothetical protein n=1 Tax=Emticicia sp. TaxID=1930953 RepID=UPI00374FF5A8